jgi:hypothetical protein
MAIFLEDSMGFSLLQYVARHSLIAAALGSFMLFSTTGCMQRPYPDVSVLSKEQMRSIRFSRIGVDLSDLKIQMPRKNYALLGTSLHRALEKKFSQSQQMGGYNHRLIVRLTNISLRMPATRENHMDQSEYIEGEVYILDANDQMLVRKRVLMSTTGINGITPWPTTSFNKKQIVALANEYAAWVHRTISGGPAT